MLEETAMIIGMSYEESKGLSQVPIFVIFAMLRRPSSSPMREMKSLVAAPFKRARRTPIAVSGPCIDPVPETLNDSTPILVLTPIGL